MEDSQDEDDLQPTHLWCINTPEKVAKILVQYCHDKEKTDPRRESHRPDDFWDEAEDHLPWCRQCIEHYYAGRRLLVEKQEKYVKTLHHREVIRLQSWIRCYLSERQESTHPSLMESSSTVPQSIAEILQHPKLLWDEDLNGDFENFAEFEISSGALIGYSANMPANHMPGVFLLLIHPNQMVRQWASQMLQRVHPITRDTYDGVSEVIAWMLSVVEFGLLDNYKVDIDTWDVYGDAVLPRNIVCVQNPLAYWKGIAQVLKSLDSETTRFRLMGSDGHRSIADTIVNVITGSKLANPDDTSEDLWQDSIFWPALECLEVLLDKLGCILWQYLTETPDRIWKEIVAHPVYDKAINGEKQMGATSPVRLSSTTPSTSTQPTSVSPDEPFVWITTYVRSFLDVCELGYNHVKCAIFFLKYRAECELDPTNTFFDSDGCPATDALERKTHLEASGILEKLMKAFLDIIENLIRLELYDFLVYTAERGWPEFFTFYLRQNLVPSGEGPSYVHDGVQGKTKQRCLKIAAELLRRGLTCHHGNKDYAELLQSLDAHRVNLTSGGRSRSRRPSGDGNLFTGKNSERFVEIMTMVLEDLKRKKEEDESEESMRVVATIAPLIQVQTGKKKSLKNKPSTSKQSTSKSNKTSLSNKVKHHQDQRKKPKIKHKKKKGDDSSTRPSERLSENISIVHNEEFDDILMPPDDAARLESTSVETGLPDGVTLVLKTGTETSAASSGQSQLSGGQAGVSTGTSRSTKDSAFVAKKKKLKKKKKEHRNSELRTGTSGSSTAHPEAATEAVTSSVAQEKITKKKKHTSPPSSGHSKLTVSTKSLSKVSKSVGKDNKLKKKKKKHKTKEKKTAEWNITSSQRVRRPSHDTTEASMDASTPSAPSVSNDIMEENPVGFVDGNPTPKGPQIPAQIPPSDIVADYILKRAGEAAEENKQDQRMQQELGRRCGFEEDEEEQEVMDDTPDVRDNEAIINEGHLVTSAESKAIIVLDSESDDTADEAELKPDLTVATENSVKLEALNDTDIIRQNEMGTSGECGGDDPMEIGSTDDDDVVEEKDEVGESGGGRDSGGDGRKDGMGGGSGGKGDGSGGLKDNDDEDDNEKKEDEDDDDDDEILLLSPIDAPIANDNYQIVGVKKEPDLDNKTTSALLGSQHQRQKMIKNTEPYNANEEAMTSGSSINDISGDANGESPDMFPSSQSFEAHDEPFYANEEGMNVGNDNSDTSGDVHGESPDMFPSTQAFEAHTDLEIMDRSDDDDKDGYDAEDESAFPSTQPFQSHSDLDMEEGEESDAPVAMETGAEMQIADGEIVDQEQFVDVYEFHGNSSCPALQPYIVVKKEKFAEVPNAGDYILLTEWPQFCKFLDGYTEEEEDQEEYTDDQQGPDGTQEIREEEVIRERDQGLEEPSVRKKEQDSDLLEDDKDEKVNRERDQGLQAASVKKEEKEWQEAGLSDQEQDQRESEEDHQMEDGISANEEKQQDILSPALHDIVKYASTNLDLEVDNLETKHQISEDVEEDDDETQDDTPMPNSNQKDQHPSEIPGSPTLLPEDSPIPSARKRHPQRLVDSDDEGQHQIQGSIEDDDNETRDAVSSPLPCNVVTDGINPSLTAEVDTSSPDASPFPSTEHDSPIPRVRKRRQYRLIDSDDDEEDEEDTYRSEDEKVLQKRRKRGKSLGRLRVKNADVKNPFKDLSLKSVDNRRENREEMETSSSEEEGNMSHGGVDESWNRSGSEDEGSSATDSESLLSPVRYSQKEPKASEDSEDERSSTTDSESLLSPLQVSQPEPKQREVVKRDFSYSINKDEITGSDSDLVEVSESRKQVKPDAIVISSEDDTKEAKKLLLDKNKMAKFKAKTKNILTPEKSARDSKGSARSKSTKEDTKPKCSEDNADNMKPENSENKRKHANSEDGTIPASSEKDPKPKSFEKDPKSSKVEPKSGSSEDERPHENSEDGAISTNSEKHPKPKSSEVGMKPKCSGDDTKPQSSEKDPEPKSSEVGMKQKSSEVGTKPQSSQKDPKPKSTEVGPKPKSSVADTKPKGSEDDMRSKSSDNNAKEVTGNKIFKLNKNKLAKWTAKAKLILPKRSGNDAQPKSSEDVEIPKCCEDTRKTDTRSTEPLGVHSKNDTRKTLKIDKMKLAKLQVKAKHAFSPEKSSSSKEIDSSFKARKSDSTTGKDSSKGQEMVRKARRDVNDAAAESELRVEEHMDENQDDNSAVKVENDLIDPVVEKAPIAAIEEEVGNRCELIDSDLYSHNVTGQTRRSTPPLYTIDDEEEDFSSQCELIDEDVYSQLPPDVLVISSDEDSDDDDEVYLIDLTSIQIKDEPEDEKAVDDIDDEFDVKPVIKQETREQKVKLEVQSDAEAAIEVDSDDESMQNKLVADNGGILEPELSASESGKLANQIYKDVLKAKRFEKGKRREGSTTPSSGVSLYSDITSEGGTGGTPIAGGRPDGSQSTMYSDITSDDDFDLYSQREAENKLDEKDAEKKPDKKDVEMKLGDGVKIQRVSASISSEGGAAVNADDVVQRDTPTFEFDQGEADDDNANFDGDDNGGGAMETEQREDEVISTKDIDEGGELDASIIGDADDDNAIVDSDRETPSPPPNNDAGRPLPASSFYGDQRKEMSRADQIAAEKYLEEIADKTCSSPSTLKGKSLWTPPSKSNNNRPQQRDAPNRQVTQNQQQDKPKARAPVKSCARKGASRLAPLLDTMTGKDGSSSSPQKATGQRNSTHAHRQKDSLHGIEGIQPLVESNRRIGSEAGTSSVAGLSEDKRASTKSTKASTAVTGVEDMEQRGKENEPSTDRSGAVATTPVLPPPAAPPPPRQITWPAAITQPTQALTEMDLLQWVLAWRCEWLAWALQSGREFNDVNSILADCRYPRLSNHKDMPIRFLSMDRYYEVFIPLLMIETWAKLQKDYNPNVNPVMQCIVDQPGRENAQFREFTVQVPIPRGKEKDPKFVLNENDFILVSTNPDPAAIFDGRFAAVQRVITRDIPQAGQQGYMGLPGELPREEAPMKVLNVMLRIRVGDRNFRGVSGEQLNIQVMGSLITSIRQFLAIKCLAKSPLARDILQYRRMDVFHHLNQASVPSPHTIIPCTSAEASQAAVHAVVSRPDPLPSVFLLQGPPGTGKTTTIIDIVVKLLTIRDASTPYRSPVGPGPCPPKILLCAPSNAAVDILVRRLVNALLKLERGGYTRPGGPINYHNAGQHYVIRLGQSKEVHADVKKFCLEEIIEGIKERNQNANKFCDEQIQVLNRQIGDVELRINRLTLSESNRDGNEIKQQKDLRDNLYMQRRKLEEKQRAQNQPHQRQRPNANVDRMREKALTRADVICCTLNYSGSGMFQRQIYKSNNNGQEQMIFLSPVIVDEATQCTEPDVLVPLQYGTCKLILAGDPKQLPATVISQVASGKRYTQSLFERYYRFFMMNRKVLPYIPIHMLKTQYRMHTEICSFPSRQFYDNMVETDPGIARMREGFFLNPYMLFDVRDGVERRYNNQGAISNEEEGEFIIALYNYIQVALDNKRRSSPEASGLTLAIGIITPYQTQKNYLRRRFQRIPHVEIETVDSFQGKEKDIIIMSCVRTNGETRGIGFVADPKRLNVSMTRARYALYVVGKLRSLATDRHWHDLISDANERGIIVPAVRVNGCFDKWVEKCKRRQSSNNSISNARRESDTGGQNRTKVDCENNTYTPHQRKGTSSEHGRKTSTPHEEMSTSSEHGRKNGTPHNEKAASSNRERKTVPSKHKSETTHREKMSSSSEHENNNLRVKKSALSDPRKVSGQQHETINKSSSPSGTRLIPNFYKPLQSRTETTPQRSVNSGENGPLDERSSASSRGSSKTTPSGIQKRRHSENHRHGSDKRSKEKHDQKKLNGAERRASIERTQGSALKSQNSDGHRRTASSNKDQQGSDKIRRVSADGHHKKSSNQQSGSERHRHESRNRRKEKQSTGSEVGKKKDASVQNENRLDGMPRKDNTKSSSSGNRAQKRSSLDTQQKVGKAQSHSNGQRHKSDKSSNRQQANSSVHNNKQLNPSGASIKPNKSDGTHFTTVPSGESQKPKDLFKKAGAFKENRRSSLGQVNDKDKRRRASIDGNMIQTTDNVGSASASSSTNQVSVGNGSAPPVNTRRPAMTSTPEKIGGKLEGVKLIISPKARQKLSREVQRVSPESPSPRQMHPVNVNPAPHPKDPRLMKGTSYTRNETSAEGSRPFDRRRDPKCLSPVRNQTGSSGGQGSWQPLSPSRQVARRGKAFRPGSGPGRPNSGTSPLNRNLFEHIPPVQEKTSDDEEPLSQNSRLRIVVDRVTKQYSNQPKMKLVEADPLLRRRRGSGSVDSRADKTEAVLEETVPPEEDTGNDGDGSSSKDEDIEARPENRAKRRKKDTKTGESGSVQPVQPASIPPTQRTSFSATSRSTINYDACAYVPNQKRRTAHKRKGDPSSGEDGEPEPKRTPPPHKVTHSNSATPGATPPNSRQVGVSSASASRPTIMHHNAIPISSNEYSTSSDKRHMVEETAGNHGSINQPSYAPYPQQVHNSNRMNLTPPEFSRQYSSPTSMQRGGHRTVQRRFSDPPNVARANPPSTMGFYTPHEEGYQRTNRHDNPNPQISRNHPRFVVPNQERVGGDRNRTGTSHLQARNPEQNWQNASVNESGHSDHRREPSMLRPILKHPSHQRQQRGRVSFSNDTKDNTQESRQKSKQYQTQGSQPRR